MIENILKDIARAIQEQPSGWTSFDVSWLASISAMDLHLLEIGLVRISKKMHVDFMSVQDFANDSIILQWSRK